MLSEADTQAHLRSLRAGDKSVREKMLLGHARLVYSLVTRFLNSGHDPEDLFQIGCIGLLKAIDRFDLNIGVRFSTYAVPLIIGEIRRFLRDDGPIKVSRSIKETAHRVRKCSETLRAELGRDARLSEIAASLELNEEEIVSALLAMRPMASLEEKISSSDSNSMYLVDCLKLEEPVQEAVVENIALQQLMASLSPKEQRIITARYFENRTQSQVASELGVSQVQISRLEKAILARLRRLLD
ncbi:MAG: SigB/SigF/SigG family RNA polymerase sigma factor [Firmicutes bacterium]|nr:SigB/SigF/SigG family RNA polymerase sigma factor [Dethiobacter sp.]MBS3889337.1 SigB/SigF/SigG family RNA polymerase sigma factor [Bacillota bacterium]MBS4055020.1 SigB/SigF/SigG family RNA polymerase sigma factor [Thermaerobacter sp.]